MNTKLRVIVQIQSGMRLSCLQYNITNGYLQSIARESKYILKVQIYFFFMSKQNHHPFYSHNEARL